MTAGSGFDQLHIAHLLDVYAPTDLTVCDDQVLADCVAALAVIRAGFVEAHRQVEVRYRRFAADCEQLARRCEETA